MRAIDNFVHGQLESANIALFMHVGASTAKVAVGKEATEFLGPFPQDPMMALE